MKKLFLILTLILSTLSGLAQGTLNNKEIQLNGGIGLSSFGLPFYAGLDYVVGKNFTIGGDFSYRGYSDSNIGDFKYSYTIIGIGANGNYHFNEVLDLPKKFDLYGGATLNYFIWKNSFKYTGPAQDEIFFNSFKPNYSGNSGLGFGLQVGGRYFISDKFGLNLEFGGGSFFGGKLGITYKLGGGKGNKRSKSSAKENSSSRVENTPKETVKPAESKAIESKSSTATSTKGTTTTTSKKKTVTSSKKKVTTKKKK